MVKFSSTFFVRFPDSSNSSTKSIITAMKSLISQLIRAGGNSTLEKIFFIDNKLTILALKNENHLSSFNQNLSIEEKEEGLQIIANLPFKMPLYQLIQILKKVVYSIEKKQLKGKGNLVINKIDWTEPKLTIDLRKQIEQTDYALQSKNYQGNTKTF